jgi:hypothetical protein
METNINSLRLAWTNDHALERRAVELACIGSTAELEAYLDLLVRRGDLQLGASNADKDSNRA